jgi:hypothetical protein
MSPVGVESLGAIDQCAQVQEDPLDAVPGEHDALVGQPIELAGHRVPT